MTVGGPRCSCGQELKEWRYTARDERAHVVWCAALADLVDYQLNKPTRHEVQDAWGRRIRRGRCADQRTP